MTGLGVTALGVDGTGRDGLGVTGLGVTGLGVTALGMTALEVFELGATSPSATWPACSGPEWAARTGGGAGATIAADAGGWLAGGAGAAGGSRSSVVEFVFEAVGSGPGLPLSIKADSSESWAGVAMGIRSIMRMIVSAALSPGGSQRWPAAACAFAWAKRPAKDWFSAFAKCTVISTAQTANKAQRLAARILTFPVRFINLAP